MLDRSVQSPLATARRRADAYLTAGPALRYADPSVETPVQTRREYDMRFLHAGVPPTHVDPTRSLPISAVPRARSTT